MWPNFNESVGISLSTYWGPGTGLGTAEPVGNCLGPTVWLMKCQLGNFNSFYPWPEKKNYSCNLLFSPTSWSSNLTHIIIHLDPGKQTRQQGQAPLLLLKSVSESDLHVHRKWLNAHQTSFCTLLLNWLIIVWNMLITLSFWPTDIQAWGPRDDEGDKVL